MAISNELRRLVDPNNECCCEYCFSIKCKEWAFKNNRELYSSSRGHCYISNLNRNNASNTIDHYGETEIEAVIKTCEWVLEDLKKNI